MGLVLGHSGQNGVLIPWVLRLPSSSVRLAPQPSHLYSRSLERGPP